MDLVSVLLVEDDRTIVENLTGFLKEEGFSVKSIGRQEEALRLLEEQKFDLALLDITLASGSGFSICARIKAEYQIPVIFLTAMSDEYSVVAGLDMGADDYISKPFRPRELVSRMKSVLRRYLRSSQIVTVQDISVDVEKGVVKRDSREIFLSALEYRLLLVFLNHRGKIMTRSALMEELWDITGEYVNDNTLTVYIKRLREKIEKDPQNPVIVKTVRGMGYKME